MGDGGACSSDESEVPIEVDGIAQFLQRRFPASNMAALRFDGKVVVVTGAGGGMEYFILSILYEAICL